MMLNSVNNNQTTFGMAFKAPPTKQGMGAMVDNLCGLNNLPLWIIHGTADKKRASALLSKLILS